MLLRVVPLIVAMAVVVPAAADGAAAPALTISGRDTDVWSLARPTPVLTIRGTAGAKVSWTLSGTRRKGSGRSPLRVTLTGLPTGSYTLTATQASPKATAKRVVVVDVTPPAITIRAPAEGAAYLPGQAVEVDFSCSGAVACVGQTPDGALLPTGTAGPATFTVAAVDEAGNPATRAVGYVVGPAAPTISVRPAGPVQGIRPLFAWTGGEPGATFTWQVLSGGTVVSQGDTPSAQVSLGPLAPGSYAFQVRQTVAPGRTGPFSVADPFTVVRGVTAAGPARPPTLNAAALRPRAGSVTTSARPLLSWRRSRGAALYNLQVFRVTAGGMTKVRSAFPRGTRARVHGLRFGDRYAWRIWPFVAGKGYSAAPLGLSYFDLARPVRPTRAQMGTDRRIAVSALRRAGAIEAWLDAGVVAGDLRHQGLGAAAFDPALGPSGPADAGGTSAAAVRPIGLGSGPRGPGALPVTAGTLRRTRLIARAALRRVRRARGAPRRGPHGRRRRRRGDRGREAGPGGHPGPRPRRDARGGAERSAAGARAADRGRPRDPDAPAGHAARRPGGGAAGRGAAPAPAPGPVNGRLRARLPGSGRSGARAAPLSPAPAPPI